MFKTMSAQENDLNDLSDLGMKKPATNSQAGGGRSAVVGYIEGVRIFARLQPPFKLVLHHLRRETLKI